MTKSNRQTLLAQVEAKAEARKQQFEAANAKITERAGRNIFLALVSGFALAAVVVAALIFHDLLLTPLALIIGVLGLYELATAFRKAGRRVPRVGVALGGSAIIVLTSLYGGQGALIGLLIGSIILSLWRLTESILPQFHTAGHSMVADLAAGVFCLVYVPFLLSLVLQLGLKPENGPWWVFTLLLLTFSNDTGAYVCGLSFGKHKMSPRISPNKTWEGFAGGALFVLIAALLAGHFLLQIPLWGCVLLAFAVVCTAAGGDLIESLIKRDLGVKDMSGLMPGHGGLLDRLDSILPSSVPFYAAAVGVGVL